MTSKRVFSVFLVLLLVVVSAFAAKINLKDGIYGAQASEASYGYTAFVMLEIDNGKIVKVVADEVSADGKLKSNDEGYRANMEPKTGTYPSKFYTDLAMQLLKEQNPDKVDVVSGATHATHNFVKLVKAILEDGKLGQTITVNLK
ncbi:FMN-binding protein [Oceanotoga sp. DSM 15011]|jgi:major membrane immunogen (membrane-anchored lipoprotein)|uniref:FMN-binding protein n=1 Tax=Oceanotoga sp. DSM 15011 TaxID=2984951 RepID=UPI0021F447C7|nr:FMN-binding protein [Oceanotoga sp. DSM 15011]UYO98910.1 FMN-binding protein [Oceanotoga sp. DSM 15011]